MLARLDADGCARYVVTDVHQGRHADRARTCDLLRRVCAAPTGRSIASGGGRPAWPTCARSPGCVPLGVEGAIVGKALYAGAFTLPEALAAVRDEPAQ